MQDSLLAELTSFVGLRHLDESSGLRPSLCFPHHLRLGLLLKSKADPEPPLLLDHIWRSEMLCPAHGTDRHFPGLMYRMLTCLSTDERRQSLSSNRPSGQ